MNDNDFVSNLIAERNQLAAQLSTEQKQKIAALVLAFIVGLLNVFGINVPVVPTI